ncbi:hypothetical protein EUGRSUZ_K01016, partial [Eucalyptus grandis]
RIFSAPHETFSPRYQLRENPIRSNPTMKKSGVLAASVAAASATAITASSSSPSPSPASSTNFSCSSNFQFSRQGDGERRDRDDGAKPKPASADKFAPKFDGLRFIETLVTAHR